MRIETSFTRMRSTPTRGVFFSSPPGVARPAVVTPRGAFSSPRFYAKYRAAGSFTSPTALYGDGRKNEEAILRFFVRRLETRGWDSQRVRESIVGASGDNITDVWLAMSRIYGLGVKETALMESPWLEHTIASGTWEDWMGVRMESVGSVDERELSGGTLRRQHAPRVWLKMENTQPTGSFKVRGACNAILETRNALGAAARFAVSSTGNHALACVHALGAVRQLEGVRAGQGDEDGDDGDDGDDNDDGGDNDSVLDVYLPSSVSKRKLARIERLVEQTGCNANVIVLDVEDCVEAEVRARGDAAAKGRHYVSPYNDEGVIAGHGTLAIELMMELSPEQLDCVFVPVGGGGLISGIARVLKHLAPHVRVIGCQAAACPVMSRSVDEGSIVECTDWNETLAEGLAGGIESDSCTFETCKALVDEWVTVSEKDIAEALVGMHGNHGQLVEGAAAVTLAAIMKAGVSIRDKGVVGIVCGGNLDTKDLDRAYDIVRKRGSRDDESDASRANAF